MTILFVGNVDESLNIVATEFDSNAVGIMPENLNKLTSYDTAYISIGDHDFYSFLHALEMAKELRYVPSDHWEHPETKMQTEMWLRYFSHRKEVKDLPKITFNPAVKLAAVRQGEGPQIWISGDHMVAGLGVPENEIFIQLVAKELNYPINYLVNEIASIDWCADQILRSDIRKDDIVIWVTPGVEKLTTSELQVQRLLETSNSSTANSQYQEIEQAKRLNLVNMAMTAIQRVMCHKQLIGYKLLVTTLPENSSEVEMIILNYLTQFSEFVHFYADTREYIDFNYNGNGDGPGPLQHKKFAKLILSNL